MDDRYFQSLYLFSAEGCAQTVETIGVWTFTNHSLLAQTLQLSRVRLVVTRMGLPRGSAGGAPSTVADGRRPAHDPPRCRHPRTVVPKASGHKEAHGHCLNRESGGAHEVEQRAVSSNEAASQAVLAAASANASARICRVDTLEISSHIIRSAETRDSSHPAPRLRLGGGSHPSSGFHVPSSPTDLL